ncbi:uncharacterized protein BDV17DRAFT_292568 [Aspergillus undulatus]|uniref:uncharacterized protein n=1 Tax=Aspergillus undulatus TaxID=1810928 RepID=UPI003CCDC18F
MKPTKHFCCTICQRGFTRIDHLKRHHLRHSGLKPYSCVFCSESFARWCVSDRPVHFQVFVDDDMSSDNLRDHYADCAKRGDREIPETGQRGRRRHACQSCTSMKLRCDGQTPCGSCVKRNLECNKERKNPTASPGADSDAPSTKHEDYDRRSDRGSIKFLLNGGTDSFTEDFLLPPRSDRSRGLEYHHQKEEAESSMLAFEPKGVTTNFAPAFVELDPNSLSFFQDTFLDFFNGPFGEMHKSMVDPYAGGMMDYPPVIPGQDPNLAFTGQQPLEPERPYTTALIQAILSRAWSVPLDAKIHEEISTNLTFLLTTARIQKFIALYFKYWHANCTIIHMPSFDPNTVALPLLTSVVFMGAMYTKDERELYAAKRLLDFAELYVFSSDIFSCEYEMAATICGGRNAENESHDWLQFQNFQAGFLMVVVQYWAGGPVSSSRAMENRFGEVIKVARRIGLVRYRHTPEDGIDETIWIQNESRIRNMNIVSTLDNAFSFYQNYPCRLSHTEYQWEFPCLDSVFASEHPFAEPNFQVSRGMAIRDAFDELFDEPNGRTEPTSSPATTAIARLTVLDMFVLIHLLYAFINTHMTSLAPLMRSTQNLVHKQSVSVSSLGKRRQSAVQEDSTLIPIRVALARWRDQWLTLRNTVTSREWASMGFYKNGYNFWLVSQLLITKKESVDVVMKMEVRCEDKLEKLKVLLKDEND